MPILHRTPSGPEIELSGKRLRADDILHVRREDISERDNAGTLLAMVTFALLATIVMIGVGEFAWSPHFLVAAFGMAALAMMNLSELWVRAVTYRRYDIALVGGERIDFTTADPDVGDALERMLSAPAAVRAD